jgi:hypothetical protein
MLNQFQDIVEDPWSGILSFILCLFIKAINQCHNQMPLLGWHIFPKCRHCIKQADPVLEESLTSFKLTVNLFAPTIEIQPMMRVQVHLLE